jgi:hypothetical protein
MKQLSIALILGLWMTVPAFCGAGHGPPPVPEPSAIGLAATVVGFVGLAFAFRKKKK